MKKSIRFISFVLSIILLSSTMNTTVFASELSIDETLTVTENNDINSIDLAETEISNEELVSETEISSDETLTCDVNDELLSVEITAENTNINFTTINNTTTDSEKIALAINKAEKILNQMNNTLSNPTDFDKALYLFDWLAVHTEYGNIASPSNYALFNLLIGGKGVCGDYAQTYMFLLKQSGISCGTITSPEQEHIWNIVKINNKYYYVDCSAVPRRLDNYLWRNSIFLVSRDALPVATSDWIYNEYGDDENLSKYIYNNDPTSKDYDNFDWSTIDMTTFDDSIFNPSYSQGVNIVNLNGYTAIATENQIQLISNPTQYINQSILNNKLATVTLSDSEASTRYIHDISANGTTVTYHTWLKSNPSESTQETHTIDWSEYFRGSLGSDITWSYLNGALTISGTGAMPDYYSNRECPWQDFRSLINEVHIGDEITEITYYPAYEENLTDIFYAGSLSQWKARTKYSVSEDIDVHFDKFDVVFLNKAGTAIETQIIEEDGNATEIEAPSITNYTFKGWYEDPDFNKAFDFDTEIEQDYTLYPKYVKSQVTIQFKSNGGSSVSSITVEGETVIEEPEEPQKEHYSFVGWFLDDKTFKKPFDFTKPVLDDTILYAKWANEDEEITVTFIIYTDTVYSEVKIFKGDTVDEPTKPKRKNYIFMGWFEDPQYKKPFNFETTLQASKTLYGRLVEGAYVYFEPNNGEDEITIVTAKGDKIDPPETPIKNGFTFDGWYTDDNTFKYKFDFTKTPITDTYNYFYAKWVKGNVSPDPVIDIKVIETPIAVNQKVNTDLPEYFGRRYTKYELSNKKLAKMNSKGRLWAKKAGVVNVYGLVRSGKKWVRDPKSGGISITIEAVTIAKANKTITATKPDKLIDVAKVFEAKTVKPVSFSSSNLKVATVDPETGIVTTALKGTTTITAYYGTGKNAAKYKMKVKVVKPKLNKKKATLAIGKALKLKVKNIPKSEPVTWRSSYPEAVSVSEAGRVYVIKYPNETDGAVTITATVDEVDYSAVISVKKPKLSKAAATLATGESLTLTVKNIPKSKPVTWSSSNPDVATVSEKGKVYLKKYDNLTEGKVIITATIDEVGYDCVITAKKPAFTKKSISLKKGKTAKPELKNTKFKLASCTNWRSDNENVAIFTNGKIKGIGGGTTTLYTDIAGATISITVKVSGAPVSSVP